MRRQSTFSVDVKRILSEPVSELACLLLVRCECLCLFNLKRFKKEIGRKAKK